MSNINYEYIEEYLGKLLPSSNGIFKEMEYYASENNIPIITKDIRALLNIIIKSTNAKRILEIGTAIAYSTISMAESAGLDSKIISIEKDSKLADLAIENIKKAALTNNIQIVKGDALDVLDSIDSIFDIIFLDGAKGQYMDFFNKSISKLKNGGLFICDNVLFRGMVAEKSLFEKRKVTIVKRLKKFLEYINKLESLETSIVPIGDGLSISIKLKEVFTNE